MKNAKLRERCPDRETWCSYLDGSITGEKKAELANHLKDCDSCFNKVASIKAALTRVEEESSLMKTPPWLLEEGKKLAPKPAWKLTWLVKIRAWLRENSKKLVPRPVTKPAWKLVSYAVAACLVLGIALWTYRTFFFRGIPIPSAEEMYSALQRALEADKRSIPPDLDDIIGEQGFAFYGFSEVSSTEARVFKVGALLADLKIGSDYLPAAGDDNLQTLRLMSDELTALGAPKSLLKSLDTISSKIKSGSYSKEEMSSTLTDLHSDVYDFIEARSKNAKIYFHIGGWLEGLWVTARVVKTTGGVTPENQALFQQSEAAGYLLEFFKAADVPKGVTKSLERLVWLSNKRNLTDRDINAILADTENLRRLLS